MKKLSLISMSASAVLFVFLGVTNLSANSCGSGGNKCGDSKKEMRNDSGKCGDSKKEMRNNSGKCGDSKKEMRNDSGKCGDSKKTPPKAGKCGVGKCG